MRKGLVVALIVVVVLAALLVAFNPRIRCAVTLGNWESNTFRKIGSPVNPVTVGRCNY